MGLRNFRDAASKFILSALCILTLGCENPEGPGRQGQATTPAWPTTLESAVDDLLARMDVRDREKLRAMPREKLILLHHTLGMAIRNRYGLWQGNKLLMLSVCGDLCEPDIASMIIIEASWLALRTPGIH